MIKPFVRKELYERIHLHNSSAGYENFFKKFVPRSHMPSDYGGNLASVLELHEQNRKVLEEMRDYFLWEEDQLNLKFEDKVFDDSNNDDDDEEFYDAED